MKKFEHYLFNIIYSNSYSISSTLDIYSSLFPERSSKSLSVECVLIEEKPKIVLPASPFQKKKKVQVLNYRISFIKVLYKK